MKIQEEMRATIGSNEVGAPATKVWGLPLNGQCLLGDVRLVGWVGPGRAR
ncbi:hypothetical protein HanIR_Chr13g0648451 [Helianthus annuus]|nr:hypothetical protein HanIR_Chr13g0648451 [Helianthus annuus]